MRDVTSHEFVQSALQISVMLARMPIDRDAWAIAFGLNTRGATGIVLAGAGRSAGVIAWLHDG